MDDFITASVGLDVHVDSIAIGAAKAGREPPRFVGTVVPKLPSLLKALGSVGLVVRNNSIGVRFGSPDLIVVDCGMIDPWGRRSGF